MTDLQKELLEIYKEFARICNKLNLRYFASFGTLIGAVRHDGFIPWDDDMDICMFRDDYETFIKEGNKVVSSSFFIQSSLTDAYWHWPFAKMRKNNTTAIEPQFIKAKFHQGIWIDIFPLDKCSNDPSERSKEEKYKKQLFRRITMSYHRKTKILGKIYNCYIYLKYPSILKTEHKIFELMTKHNDESGEDYYISSWEDRTDSKFLFKSCDLVEFCTHKFEDTSIIIPKNFDSLLQTTYGDWTKIPEKKDRKSGHQIMLLDLKHDYSEYFNNGEKKDGKKGK